MSNIFLALARKAFLKKKNLRTSNQEEFTFKYQLHYIQLFSLHLNIRRSFLKIYLRSVALCMSEIWKRENSETFLSSKQGGCLK